MIGRAYDDERLQAVRSSWKFNTVQKNGQLCYDVLCYGKKEVLTPVQVSGMILSRLKKEAEKFLETSISEAVITVPAYFNNTQREATALAAQTADLKVLRIVNEPTAAVLAHCDGQKFATGDKKILVYDLGGGTFDITIAECQDEIIDVLATSGDSFLGGRDFDQNMAEYFVRHVEKQCGKGIKDNKRAFIRLLQACNISKHQLSSVTSTTVVVDNLLNGKDFTSNISRARFEGLNEHLFKKTLDSIQIALIDAKLQKEDINAVLMVGGSSRIFKIRQMIQEFFPGTPLVNSGNPEETVARGAAILASLIKAPSAQLMQVVLIDVCPLSLGVQSKDDVMSFIIKRNRSIPCQATKAFQTTKDSQQSIKFSIFEGERSIASQNNILGSFILEGIKRGFKGQYKYDVTFNVDINGILNAKAEERATGKCEGVTIRREKHEPDEVEALLEDEQRFANQDRIEMRRVQAKQKLEQYLYQVWLCFLHLSFFYICRSDFPKKDLSHE